MSTPSNRLVVTNRTTPLDWSGWLRIGVMAAAVSIVAVLAVQAITRTMWPDSALFKPLDSYARSALFTLVPALGATASFAWIAARRERPVTDFIRIAAVVLMLSIIPDFALPLAHKTLLASTITASLHVVAALSTVGMIITGYRRERGRT